MAGARQRLPDRGARRAPVPAHGRARPAALRPARRAGRRRRARARAARRPGFVARLRIFNPDGSEAELSGNGAREAILYLRRAGWTDQRQFSIQTAAGEIRPTILGPSTCRVDMGRATLRSPNYPSGDADGTGEIGGRRFQHVTIGNPQCAIRIADVAELEALDLAVEGPPSSTTRASRTARTCRSGPRLARPRSAPGSSSAAWGRRSRRAPALRRRRRLRAARRRLARHRRARRRRAGGRRRRVAARRPDRLGRAVYRAEVSPELLDELA